MGRPGVGTICAGSSITAPLYIYRKRAQACAPLKKKQLKIYIFKKTCSCGVWVLVHGDTAKTKRFRNAATRRLSFPWSITCHRSSFLVSFLI